MESVGWRAMVAIGFLLGQALLLYTFYETQKATRQIESIRLAKELSSEFYGRDGLYRDVRNAIEECASLYKSWGGRFDHDEINRYLGFFEDLGFYYRRGMLDIEAIGHLYGAYIIEAFAHPDVKRYISLLRSNAKQPGAFELFESLATELRGQQQFQELASAAEVMCQAPKQAANKT
jgi:hypothetical protein